MKSLDSNKNTTIYVAISGGVDSSVSAYLLKKGGFNVVGVFMKPWQPDRGNFKCLWKEDREYALRVCSHLNIPFKTWDFSKEYKKEVADYMIQEYKLGRTPNPDIMCNKEIKFGLFFKRALKEGADLIATGHYARVKKVMGKKDKSESFALLAGKDKNKDQSYFLWTLNQEQLSKTLFPVGNLDKSEVRKLAKKINLPNHDKKDSQGICFIGSIDVKDFLKEYIVPKNGSILDEDGNNIGMHEGAYYYTIGQRHGLNITNGQGPYYVLSKDIKKNIIFVGKEEKLMSNQTKVNGFSWTGEEPIFPVKIKARLRYRAQLKDAILEKSGKLNLRKSERAISPGQSAVFYKKDQVLGGGIII